MTDAEYIRKAVELASEWHYDDDFDFIFGPFDLSQPVIGLGSFYIDALGVQLLKQVNALPGCWIEIKKNEVRILSPGGPMYEWSLRGSDLMMSAIRLIVDSRYLER